MSLVTHLLIYSFVWWILFFMALPFGVRPPENPGDFDDAGAPDNPQLWKKALIVSLLAIPVTALVEWGMGDLMTHLRDSVWQTG